MIPTANSTWFNVTISGKPYAVYSFRGVEEVHKPYEFTVEFVSLSSAENINDMVGKEACLTIIDRAGEKRPVHGLVRQAEQLHTSNLYTHYRVTIVPRLWFLDKIVDHRIFQEKSVVDIIEKVLQEQGFSSGSTFAFKLFYKYEPREYCVQYGESYLHFIARLCEEEGIYYYHEHTEQSHKLCFCDREDGPFIPGTSKLRFYPGSGHDAGSTAQAGVIQRLNVFRRVNSNAASYREWNFKKPRLQQDVFKDEGADKALTPQSMLLEQYRYPHLYTTPKKDQEEPRTFGEQYANVQLLRQLTFTAWVEGESNVARFLPSYVFSVHSHPRADANADWWVVRCEHEGEQPGVLQHEAPAERGLHYKSTFKAIPRLTRFVPERDHPKNIAHSDQTALVTGPEGEEIYPDKWGRVKVQFFWDREGKWDDTSTCWIRVAQGWAGPQYGTMAIPRVGHEVVVSFLEGNPDRPLITGRVYHDLNMQHYELPKHKTRTYFKSMTVKPGGEQEGEERGFNEFRIEDKKDQEEIYVHGEKDVNVHVKHDWKEYILHDYHETVDNFRYTVIPEDPPKVEEEHTTRERKPRSNQQQNSEQKKEEEKPSEVHHLGEDYRLAELKDKDHFTIHENSHTEYKTKWLAKADDEIHLESLVKAVLEAGADLTIKVGPSFVHLSGSGVEIVGPQVKINSGGSAGEGTPAEPELPKGAEPPPVPPCPICPSCLKKAKELESPTCGAY